MSQPWEIDEATAIDELKALSKNAKRWLEDRIGNNLAAITGYCAIGREHMVPAVSDKLIADFNQIGCFEMQRLRAAGRKGE
jgi:hypothetical protein